MARDIAEADWKTFKKIRLVALERFSQRVLDQCQEICADNALTAYDRYGRLYDLIHQRDKEMASAFNDLRRSTAFLCLWNIVSYRLLTEEELSEFSQEIQNRLDWVEAWS